MQSWHCHMHESLQRFSSEKEPPVRAKARCDMVPANPFRFPSAHFLTWPQAPATPRDCGFIQHASTFTATRGWVQQALSNCWKGEGLTWSFCAGLPVSWKESHLLNEPHLLKLTLPQVFTLCLLYARHIFLLSPVCCQLWSQSASVPGDRLSVPSHKSFPGRFSWLPGLAIQNVLGK